MPTLRLTDDQTYMLINALHVAIERYAENAVDAPPLAEQFQRQVQEVRALAALIENAGD